MLAAMAGFTCSDACIKLAGEALPLGQAILIRGLIASPLVIALAWRAGALPSPAVLASPSLRVRTFGEVASTFLYLAALLRLPLANITAINAATPLMTAAGAHLFLGERVGPRRWTAILLGLAGVLVMVRPGFAGFTPWSLVALAAVLLIALRDLATRRLPDHVPSLAVVAVTTVSVTLLGLGLSAFETWAPVTPAALGLLALGALFLISGYIFITLAMRAGEVAVVAPFRYSSLIWAPILQLAVFGDPLDGATLIGGGVIVAAGLYALWAERRRARMAEAGRAAAAPGE